MFLPNSQEYAFGNSLPAPGAIKYFSSPEIEMFFNEGNFQM